MLKENIKLDSFYVYRPLAGCYEGVPELSSLIDSAKKRAIKLFGDDRPTHIIPYDKQNLPRWAFIIWYSGPPIDPEDHGTHLIVIGFDDKPLTDPLGSVLDLFDYNKLAGGFQY